MDQFDQIHGINGLGMGSAHCLSFIHSPPILLSIHSFTHSLLLPIHPFTILFILQQTIHPKSTQLSLSYFP